MSSLIVEVCEILEINDHPNADRLEIAKIKGWQCITGIHTKKPGDKVVYIPPDSVIPQALAEEWGVAQYCSPGYPKNEDGTRPPGCRVRAAKLRGVVSCGLIIDLPEDEDWSVGTDVANYYGIVKWDPPIKAPSGDQMPERPNFTRYTNIENYNNFPEAIPQGTPVVVTEKIHGTNSRVGRVTGEEGHRAWVAGSRKVQRKEPLAWNLSLYWMPLTTKMTDLIMGLSDDDTKDVIVFGEIYGSGVQDMAYGYNNGRKGYRVFDIMVGGMYLSWDEMVKALNGTGIDWVKIVYRGTFQADETFKFAQGGTYMCSEEGAGKFKGREGIVIKPLIEAYSDALQGRMIVKCINPDYLTRKKGTEDH